MRTLKLLVALGVIAAGVYVGFELVPPIFANYQLQDAIQNEAVLQSYSNKSEDEIRATIFKKAQDLEIPLRAEQIVVQRVGSGGSGSLAISADYTVHVDLPYYPLDLQFHPASKSAPIPGA
ncbi:MAG TPA: hypothetical protein VKR26_05285 [Terriglobales bacterium]|nr:hypothetical protein [Terriglobales bacterium]